MKPRIALPMLNLVPGATGGGETYVRELTARLDPERLDVTAYVPAGAEGASTLAREVVVPEVTAGASTRERLTVSLRATLLRRRIAARFADADVVHYPLSAMLAAPRRDQKRIVTIHDVQHLDLPGYFSRAERTYRRIAYELPTRTADLVITVSEFARRGLIRHLGLAPERVRAIHLGVDLSAFTPGGVERENFLFYPARPYAHKNHQRLLAAVARVRSSDPSLRLVLTGQGVEDLPDLPDWVDARGQVSFAELKDLYHRARLMVFPSEYEGFGLPPLEAMASGCPVASSDAASLPEVIGDAAEVFSPDSVESIETGIRTALDRADELTRLGLAHTEGMGWEECVRAHEDAYLEVAAAPGRTRR